MAMLKIRFDDTRYWVNQASLSVAFKNIQDSLVSAVAGNNTKIDFNNITYNINEAKLQTTLNKVTIYASRLPAGKHKITFGKNTLSVSGLDPVIINVAELLNKLSNNNFASNAVTGIAIAGLAVVGRSGSVE